MAVNILAYHDPDLNYHISQAQKLQDCADGSHGYSYQPPTVQLTTSGVKVAAAHNLIAQPIQTPNYAHVKTYLPPPPVTKVYAQPAVQYAAPPPVTYAQPTFSFLPQPAVTYSQQTSQPQSNYVINQQVASQREVHGYATSAGLSTYSASGRTVTPQATYAQAPILAKITAAPLIARFSTAPAKTTYVQQNSVQQAYSFGSAAKASLNSYSAVQSGGPVVSQVYSQPTAGYAVSQALRQPQQQIAPARYTAITTSTAQANVPISSPATKIVPVAQYAVQNAVQYATPVNQYHSTVQYSSAPVAQYATQATQYQAPAVTQYRSPVIDQYQPPAVQYANVAPVPQYAAPVVKVAPAPVVKNVHTDFIENYVSLLLFTSTQRTAKFLRK